MSNFGTITIFAKQDLSSFKARQDNRHSQSACYLYKHDLQIISPQHKGTT